MIPSGSRYESAEQQFAPAHQYNEWGFPLAEGVTPNITVRQVSRQTTYRMQTTQTAPNQPYEYYVKDTEGPQFLAYKFLGDAKRWWEIADANRKIWYPLDMKMGDYIVIPV